MKKIKMNISYFILALFLLSACTNLDPFLDSSIVSDNEAGKFTGVDPEGALATAYNQINLMGQQDNTYALAEVTSDELVVVTRGADWSDNGVWRDFHTHQWRPDNGQIFTTWNERNSGVFTCTQIIDKESEASKSQLAEAKTLRALNMFYIMDFFGQVPFREVNEGVNIDPKVFTREEAFDFIVKDLTEALPELGEGNPAEIFTVNQAFAHFMLAKLYLNKEVYTGSSSAEDYTKVVQNCDAITAAGYSLDSDYFGIFLPEHTNTEIILALNRTTENRIWNFLHPNQGGWNGFSTLAEVYDSFESSDIRLGEPSTVGVGTGMLIGPQFDTDGKPILNRSKNPLEFTKDYPNGIIGNTEGNGVRPFKYTNKDENGIPKPFNGLVLARYADVVLMKAEAIMRGGTSTETADSILDNLRILRGASASGSYSLDDILDERRRELYIEGWRRNDQIRFGTFNDTWDMKDNTEDFRNLFPIPNIAVITNPNLSQNPGY